MLRKPGQKTYLLISSVLFLLFFKTLALAANQDNFDVIYYEIDISINPETEIIDGLVNVQVISDIDGLSQLTLDLFDNMTVSAVTGNAASFSSRSKMKLFGLSRSCQFRSCEMINKFWIFGNCSSSSNAL